MIVCIQRRFPLTPLPSFGTHSTVPRKTSCWQDAPNALRVATPPRPARLSGAVSTDDLEMDILGQSIGGAAGLEHDRLDLDGGLGKLNFRVHECPQPV